MPITAPDFTPAFHPDWGLSRAFKPKVLMAQFGDGYAQRAADGINNNAVTLSATWTNLKPAEKDYIVDYFAARKGYQGFRYTYVDETAPKVYICTEWTSTHNDAAGYTVTASLTQVYDI
jgi:phage-related protein